MITFIKTLLRRLTQGLILLTILLLALRLFFYDDVKSWVTTKVQVYLTELDYGDLHIGDLELSVFRHFPNISVQLNKVRFYEHSIRPDRTPPILYTEQLNLVFNSWEFIRRKNLVVTKLVLDDGVLNLLTYEDNTINLERAFTIATNKNKSTPGLKKYSLDYDTNKSKKPAANLNKSKKTLLSIALEEVYFNNFIINYTNPSENYTSQVKLESLSGKLLLNETGLFCDLNTSFEITNSSEFPMIANLGPASLRLNLDFIDATQVINIHDGNIRFETISAEVKGTYNNSYNKYIDIKFDASNNDVAFLSKLIKEDALIQNSALIKKADIILYGHLKGEMEDNIPELDLNFSVRDLSLIIPQSEGRFTNIGFDGELHTGEAQDFSEGKIAIKNLRGELPGGSMSGNFTMDNFKKPSLKSSMNLALDLEDFDNIFNISSIDSLKGMLNFKSEINGKINAKDHHELDDINLWSLDLKDIGFKYIPTNKHIDMLHGNISETNNEVVLHNLSMNYDNSDISINGRIKNLYHFIFSKEQNIDAQLELKSNQFYTSHFLFNPKGTPAIEDRLSNLELHTKITMTKNNSYDTYFPIINAELTKLSFDLDTLPSVKDLTGKLEFEQTKNAFVFDLKDVIVELPYGKASINGSVLIPKDFQTLDVKVNMDLSSLPIDYVEDLINEMKDLDLLDAKHRKKEEMTIVNGVLYISGILELFPFAVHNAEITSNVLSFKGKDSSAYHLENLTIQLDSLYFLHDSISKSITGIKTTYGKLNTTSFDMPSIKKMPMYINFEGINDNLKIAFTTSEDTILNHEANLNLNLSEDTLFFDLIYNRKDISAKTLIEDYNSKIGINGDLNAVLKLSGNGSNIEEIRSSLKGGFEISSDSLIFDGIDLDDILQRYNRSQKFNLTDVSAFMIAGPFGAVVTKGSDFTSLISADLKPEQKTFISKAIARWSLNDGVLQSEDVAFSTNLNRLAFNGSLDIVKDSIPGFTVYVVDKNGCSIMQQTITGKTDNLQIGKLKIAKTLLGSVINAVKSVLGSNCKIVYDGEIKHPDSNK